VLILIRDSGRCAMARHDGERTARPMNSLLTQEVPSPGTDSERGTVFAGRARPSSSSATDTVFMSIELMLKRESLLRDLAHEWTR